MRDVVGHLVGMVPVFVALFEESPMPARGPYWPGADPAWGLPSIRRSAAGRRHSPGGPGANPDDAGGKAATPAERLQWRIVDLIAHGWDLVQATGIATELPDDLAEQALTFAQAQLPSQPRAGRFADPQPIRDDAPAIDRLAAFTGRPVPWTR